MNRRIKKKKAKAMIAQKACDGVDVRKVKVRVEHNRLKIYVTIDATIKTIRAMKWEGE